MQSYFQAKAFTEIQAYDLNIFQWTFTRDYVWCCATQKQLVFLLKL